MLAAVSGGHRPDPSVVGVQDGDAMAGKSGDELGLGAGDPLDAAEAIGVGGGHRGDDADGRWSNRGQPGDLTEAAHAHLQHEHLAAVVGTEHGDWQALLVVEAALVGDDVATGADGCSGEILGGRLADAAGDADDDGVESMGGPRGDVEQCLRRVGDLHRRQPGRQRVGGASRRQRRRRAGGCGHGDEVVTVTFADDGDEELTAADRPCVERRAVELTIVADVASPCRCGDVGDAKPHAGQNDVGRQIADCLGHESDQQRFSERLVYGPLSDRRETGGRSGRRRATARRRTWHRSASHRIRRPHRRPSVPVSPWGRGAWPAPRASVKLPVMS